MPLNRGYLATNGDARRSLYEINAADVSEETSNGGANTEDELPAPSTTRNLLTLFQSMEDHSAPAPTPERAEKVARSRNYRNSFSDNEHEKSTEAEWSVNGARPASSLGDPGRSSSPVRESDFRIDETELPERGITRGLLAKFQTMQQAK